ncbi:MAG: hypothetical protein OHK0053_00530 [Microscillaceae bacterium]
MVKFFIKGNEALARQDYPLAKRYYDAGIQLDTTLPDIFNNRGIAHFEMGQIQAARRDYDRALQMKPDFAQAYYNRANLHYAQNDFVLAIADLGKVMKALPDSAAPRLARSRAYLKSHQYERALADLNHLLKIDPNFEGGYESRGYLQLLLGQYAEAEKDLRQGLLQNPEADLAWANLGRLKLKTSAPDSALIYIQKALALNPDEPYNQNALIEYYLQTGQNELAEATLRQRKEDPERANQYWWAALALAQGKPDKAIDRLEALIRQKNFPPECYETLAQCYLLVQNMEKACFFWKKAQEIKRPVASEKMRSSCI